MVNLAREPLDVKALGDWTGAERGEARGDRDTQGQVAPSAVAGGDEHTLDMKGKRTRVVLQAEESRHFELIIRSLLET